MNTTYNPETILELDPRLAAIEMGAFGQLAVVYRALGLAPRAAWEAALADLAAFAPEEQQEAAI